MNKKYGKLNQEADKLKHKHESLKDLIPAISQLVADNSRSLPEKYEPKSILESRFTPAEAAFEKGMRSCGAIANISASILRRLGYKVKLIHGECKESVDHAWISVLDPKTNMWSEYDLTRKDADVPDTHIKKDEIESWEDIRGQIESDHETMIERRKERGLK